MRSQIWTSRNENLSYPETVSTAPFTEFGEWCNEALLEISDGDVRDTTFVWSPLTPVIWDSTQTQLHWCGHMGSMCWAAESTTGRYYRALALDNDSTAGVSGDHKTSQKKREKMKRLKCWYVVPLRILDPSFHDPIMVYRTQRTQSKKTLSREIWKVLLMNETKFYLVRVYLFRGCDESVF